MYLRVHSLIFEGLSGNVFMFQKSEFLERQVFLKCRTPAMVPSHMIIFIYISNGIFVSQCILSAGEKNVTHWRIWIAVNAVQSNFTWRSFDSILDHPTKIDNLALWETETAFSKNKTVGQTTFSQHQALISSWVWKLSGGGLTPPIKRWLKHGMMEYKPGWQDVISQSWSCDSLDQQKSFQDRLVLCPKH